MAIEKPFLLHANSFIRFSQWLGLCPFHVKNGKVYTSSRYRLFLFIAAINISINLLHMTHSFWCIDFWLIKSHIILQYIYFITPFMTRMQAFIIIIESYKQRYAQAKIFNGINSLNQILKTKLKMNNNDNRILWVFRFVYFCVFIEMFLDLISFAFKPSWDEIYYTILFFIPNITRNVQMKLSLIYIYSLKFNVQIIRDYLRRIRHDYLFSSNDRKLAQDIVYIEKCYSIIWSLSKLIDQWRFWGFAIGFLLNLLTITFGLFWSLVRVISAEYADTTDLLETLIWSLIGILEIVQICSACNSVVVTVRSKLEIWN